MSFSTILSGQEEVPPTNSQATGTAILSVLTRKFYED
jgi:hypothetical protein